MLAPALALLVLAGYAGSLWWLLRRESAHAFVWIVVLTGISVSLRLLYTTEYPAGMNEDEVKVLWCGVDFLRAGHLFVDDCSDTPGLLTILFPAQLATLIGPSRWAIRGLSFLGATLAVPAAFAAARALGLRVAASLAAAGFVATLPWALFYGRVHQAGEMYFECLLVAAFLGRFVTGRGRWPDMILGGFALTLLMQTYYSGRALVGLTLVAAVLAPGWYRLYCLGVLGVALVGYAPYFYSGSYFARVGLGGTFVQPGLAESPLATIQTKLMQSLTALIAPVADNRWLTVRAGAVHPIWMPVLAAIGGLTLGIRRGLFLWAGFLGGIAPSVVGYGQLPSTRRMLMGLPFLSLAAASALDVIPARRLRALACAVVVAVTGFTSARFYFSADFWTAESTWMFDGPRWNLVESLPVPPHPRLVVTRDLGYFIGARDVIYGPGELLAVENWYPDNAQEMIYAFGPEFGNLRPVYDGLFGVDRINSFGRAFSLRVEARDWSWLRAYGWRYEARCGDVGRTGTVPFLLARGVSFRDFECATGWLNTWRGRWLGPASTLRLYGRGTAEIEVDGQVRWKEEGWDLVGEVEVQTGSVLTVRSDPPPRVPTSAELVRVTPAGEQTPMLEWVAPVE